MNKNTIIKYTSIIAAFLLTGFLTSFFICGNNSKKSSTAPKTISDNTLKNQSVITNSESPTPDLILPCYLLKNENEILTLYEINGNKKNVVKTVSINSQIFPPEDIKKLSAGIKLSTIEEGFNLIADFSS